MLLADTTLVDRDLGRYLYVLVKYLALAGFEVTVRGAKDLHTRIVAQRWAGQLLEEPRVRIDGPVPGKPGETDIVVTDGADVAASLADLKTFQLIKGRRQTRQPGSYDVLFPYMLHPKYYANGSHLGVAQYRTKPRNVGLFFSGNYDERYRNPAILEKFGTLQRPMLLDLLFEGLHEEQLFRASPDFDSELASGHHERQFVFVDNQQGNRVAKRHWLETLGQCRFFLACPGVDMPLSHNLVEAMSVGCVPLTQYGDYFDPPLRDGVDCVAHSGSDIVDRARAVLSMDETQVALLRRNAVDYYEQHLSVDAFVRRVLEHPGQRVRIGMNFMPLDGIR